MYYYFNWPKMSGNAAGVGGGAAGILHRAPGSGGGGCGELVNGDGTCAAVATATTTTLAQCSERETSVAEAQTHNDRNNPPCFHAEIAGENNDGLAVNNTDNAVKRGCADSGEYVLGCLSAVNGQGVHPKEAGSINIDHKPSGSQHGGGHSSFMAAASRKTGNRQQPGSAGAGKNTNGESISAERGGSSLTAAAENGSLKSNPTVTKRRRCSLSRAPKRVCFAGTTTIAHCGISDSGARRPRQGCAPLRNTGGNNVLLLKSCNYSETPQPGHRTHAAEAHHRESSRECVSGCNRSDNSIRQDSICPPSALANSCVDNINSTDGRPPRTAKGRVRLYRVRSFVATTLGYNNRGRSSVAVNGVTERAQGGSNYNPSQRCPLPGHRGQERQSGQDLSCARTCSVASCHTVGKRGPERHCNNSAQKKGIQDPKEKTVEQNGTELTQNGGSQWTSSTCGDQAGSGAQGGDGGVPAETPSAEAVEMGASEVRQRQGQLEERTERLWRRLQAVQVKQMERHVVQQLRGLAGAMGRRKEGARARLQQALRPPHAPSSGELSRLARSCSEALHTAEGALDSDHTASSSGGESEGEERDDDSTPAPKNLIKGSTEWRWAEQRAGLGSRWVWLQAQVSELEYRIRALTELYTHLRQGKGRGVLQATGSLPVPITPLRASRPPHPPNSTLCSSVELPQNPLRKKQTEETPHCPSDPPGSPPSTARARPLLRQRRRKLIRLGDTAALRTKAVSVPCWCAPPEVCVLCAGNPPRGPLDNRSSPWARWAQLDLCLHPVLSFPSDMPLALQCRVPPRGTPRSHNAMRSAGMPPPSPWLAKRAQGSQKPGRLKRKPLCAPPPHSLLPPPHTADGPSERAQRGLVNPAFLSLRTASADPPFRSVTPPTADAPAQPLRRRRGESSFDIDNLVMPLGLAGLGGGARVQRLQYKEILTPSWRQLDSPSPAPAGQTGPGSDSPGEKQRATVEKEQEREEQQEEDEVEDLSDASFLIRHAQCEHRERSRWGSWAHRRRRGRSSYRGEGKVTPRTPDQPPSPEPRARLPSECGSWPPSPQETPSTPGAAVVKLPLETPESPEGEKSATGSADISTTLPWERRSFPLSEEELRWLQEEEEEDCPKDPSSTSARSQSTDSDAPSPELRGKRVERPSLVGTS
ncbi:KAT8 regulatory NSL complex subunit 1 [Megalops cyprinoides]|uniref:KAT8 regulatory NSL complex subunit 1 n=1 Tax=Megalops cyprinoides TaxID=118141 RepID=UPI0018646A0D|nr:KAT8 regulatory NSL complex subunit 1 [Megalops cyprinoides]